MLGSALIAAMAMTITLKDVSLLANTSCVLAIVS